MKRFIIHTSIFLAPIILLSTIVLTVICGYGENCSLDKVIKTQSSDRSILYGCAYVDYAGQYKMSFAKAVNPGILVLGTSRTMQISSEWFSEQFSFYNAGGGAAKLNEFIPFLEQTGVKPKLLIIGLDQFFFNPNWDKCEAYVPQKFSESNLSSIFIANFGTILKDIASGKMTLINRMKHIGVNAAQNGNGFSADGKYNYGEFLRSGNRGIDNDFEDTFSRIANSGNRFEWSDNINQRSIAAVGDIISYCKSNNIYLVAFIPPYAPSVNAKMEESGKYGYMKEIVPAINSIFQQYDYPLFDFTDCSQFSLDDDYADGFHGGSATYHSMIDSMAINCIKFSQYIK